MKKLMIVCSLIVFLSTPITTIASTTPVIVVLSTVDGDHYSLYMIDIVTHRRMALNVDEGWYAACSPDGRKVVYANNKSGTWDLYQLELATRNITQITHGLDTAYPAWSPDGKQLAFEMNFDIYTVSIDGTNLLNLTNKSPLTVTPNLQKTITVNSPLIDTRPAWSPDGKEIVFSSNRDFPDLRKALYAFDLYRIDTDGKNLTRLTRDNAKNGEANAESTFASWSPDGKHIAYSKLGGGTPYQSGLYVMNPDGSNPIRIRNIGQNTIGELQFGWMAKWSPDSQMIAVQGQSENRSTPSAHSVGEIYLVDWQNNRWELLTNDGFDNVYPSWCVIDK